MQALSLPKCDIASLMASVQLPKTEAELIEWGMRLLERASASIALAGYPATGVVCRVCGERVSVFAYTHGHRQNCRKRERAERDAERLARIAKYSAKPLPADPATKLENV